MGKRQRKKRGKDRARWSKIHSVTVREVKRVLGREREKVREG